MPAIRLNEEATRLLQSYYWNDNIRQLKNVAERVSIIETNHDITAETLRRYLPENEMETGLQPLSSFQASGDTYMNERELLYKVLFDMRKDITELKQQMAQQSQQPIQPSVVNVGTPMVKMGASTDTPSDEEFQQVEEVHDEPDSIVEIEKEAIRRALERFHGNRKATAQALGMGERTLYRKIKEYGL